MQESPGFTTRYLKIAGLTRFLLLSTILIVGGANAAPEPGGTLVVYFEGMKTGQGHIAALLVDSADKFLARDKKPVHSFLTGVTPQKTTWRIHNLPYGLYAISAYHDKNDNGELDSGLFGIPTEDYGFSNNARGSFGPPDYAEAEFEFSESGQVISIRVE